MLNISNADLAAFLKLYGNMPNMDKLNFRNWLETGDLPTTGKRDERFDLLVEMVTANNAATDAEYAYDLQASGK